MSHAASAGTDTDEHASRGVHQEHPRGVLGLDCQVADTPARVPVTCAAISVIIVAGLTLSTSEEEKG
jgi:hypothetical protein